MCVVGSSIHRNLNFKTILTHLSRHQVAIGSVLFENNIFLWTVTLVTVSNYTVCHTHHFSLIVNSFEGIQPSSSKLIQRFNLSQLTHQTLFKISVWRENSFGLRWLQSLDPLDPTLNSAAHLCRHAEDVIKLLVQRAIKIYAWIDNIQLSIWC